MEKAYIFEPRNMLKREDIAANHLIDNVLSLKHDFWVLQEIVVCE